MLLESLKLKNFRSHSDFLLEINPLTTLIIGENGSGKTSLLEAIYLALRGKSFKGTDREICKRGEDFYKLELTKNVGDKIIARYSSNEKIFELAGKKTKRLAAKDKYPVILFEPNDLYLVGSSPTRRRDYFDRFLLQLDDNYGVALRKYNKALRQRNILLKEDFSVDAIFSWNVILAKYGVEIAEKRKKMIEEINRNLTRIYRDIAGNDDMVGLIYCGVSADESSYLSELAKNLNKDGCLGYTSFGIHRDDYEFYFNNSLADGSASRGEIRSVILALKFIEAEIVKKESSKTPVVLLDDIFSELDELRQKRLVDNFKNNQIIITSTNVPQEMKTDINL